MKPVFVYCLYIFSNLSFLSLLKIFLIYLSIIDFFS